MISANIDAAGNTTTLGGHVVLGQLLGEEDFKFEISNS
jgi:hypothetical protein